MTELKFHKLTKENGIARVLLNRPDHNVFNIDMMEELTGLLSTLNEDADLKCVVLGAEGKSFCAGVEVADHKPELAPEMMRVFNALLKQIHALAVPSVAAVQGACLGGGMEVVVACDMIVASKKAIFGQPEIKLGFLPPYAAVRLPHLVGPAKAVEICTTGRRYSAKDARRMGLVSDLLDADEFEQGVDKVVKELTHASPLIIRLNKQAVTRHLGMDIDSAMESVTTMFLDELMTTEDTCEGIASFEEKRRPQWKNK
ncbi:MAG: enoyl-CoA hydratase/isomerase family protein [Desulfobacterales bacterium]|nr:enoyl-CoA hydratase/isomerase family protein [Desulfobacterales bacterium]